MLRFVLNALLLRDLIQSRYFKVALSIFFIGVLIVGVVYAYVFVNAASERSHAPHAHAPSSR